MTLSTVGNSGSGFSARHCKRSAGAMGSDRSERFVCAAIVASGRRKASVNEGRRAQTNEMINDARSKIAAGFRVGSLQSCAASWGTG